MKWLLVDTFLFIFAHREGQFFLHEGQRSGSAAVNSAPAVFRSSSLQQADGCLTGGSKPRFTARKTLGEQLLESFLCLQNYKRHACTLHVSDIEETK